MSICTMAQNARRLVAPQVRQAAMMVRLCAVEATCIREWETVLMRATLFTALVWCLANPLAAQAGDILAGADLEFGKSLSKDCVVCHNRDAVARGVPDINGQPADRLATVLTAYKTGELDNPMKKMIAGKLDARQIASLAVYFASLPKGE